MTAVLLRSALIVAGAAVAIWGLLMGPNQVAAEPILPGFEPDPYVVCPVAQAGGGFSSRVGVSRQEEGQISVIGAGEGAMVVAAEGEAFFTEVGELAELGTTPLLVETSGEAAAYTRAGTVAAMSGCVPASAGPLAVMGMSTAEGDGSTMVLVNPFASEALIRVVGASEFGVDTPTELEEVTVPPATTVEVVLD